MIVVARTLGSLACRALAIVEAIVKVTLLPIKN